MPVFYGHAGLMCVAFLLMIAGAAIARFAKSGRGWLGRHRLLGLCGVVCAWIGLTFAIIMITASGGRHFGSLHTALGALTLIMILITPALGFAQFRYRKKAVLIRAGHRLSGRVTLLLMLIQLMTGLNLAGIV